ncbi:MAG TPA: carboxymuconolactone decarboxylase family protein [Candidatus Binatia bacterium]|nr:carboxymuconolactone decarboxylase family protein [Candidatus Binatia bacterium]
MARLPYVDPATAPDDIREILEGMPVKLGVFRMMAHAESSFRSLMRLGRDILGRQQLSAKLRELAILRVANRSNARYEWVQHVPIAKGAGGSDAQVAALDRGDATASCFDAREQLLLRFTDELIDKVKVTDATFAAAQQEFSSREIVEIILAVGYYMLIARLLETTAVDLEADAGTKIVDALKRTVSGES